MPDSMAGCLLLAALLSSLAGMGWLALSMQPHAQQVWVRGCSRHTPGLLRLLGVAGLVVALALCLVVDHASMAVLVWVMSLAAGALTTAFVLTWRAHWLRVLAPWVHAVH